MKAKRLFRKKHGECTYCGSVGPITRDHIPPRSLFPRTPPKNLITVPCCNRCNQAASKDDEYFRLVVAARHDVGEHPVVREILQKAMRSLTYPEQRCFRAAFVKGLRKLPTYTASGLYAGHRGAYDVNLRRLDAVVARIVKALLYRRNGSRLPDGYDVSAVSYDGLRGLGPLELAEFGRQLSECFAVGRAEAFDDGVLAYASVAAADDPYCSVWQLRFYGRVGFIALSGPSGPLLQRGYPLDRRL